MKKARARTNTTLMREDLLQALSVIRKDVFSGAESGPHQCDLEEAFATVETFCAIALRVFAKTNPSKLRSEAVTVELSTLMY